MSLCEPFVIMETYTNEYGKIPNVTSKWIHCTDLTFELPSDDRWFIHCFVCHLLRLLILTTESVVI